MRLLAAKKRFRGEWLAFQFIDETKQTGKVILRDRDRHKLYQKLGSRKLKATNVYVTYAGPLLPKDYSVILLTLL